MSLEILIEEIINNRKECLLLEKNQNVYHEKIISFSNASLILNVLADCSSASGRVFFYLKMKIPLLEISDLKFPLSELSKRLINKLLKKKVENEVFLEENFFFTKPLEKFSNENFAQIITPKCK